MPINRWESTKSNQLTGHSQLVYRSNLLGSDRTIVNWGGGNTSMKTTEVDFRGDNVRVLWVKGSGSDLAGAKSENFTALHLDDIRRLFEREDMSDEEMVNYLTHCKLGPSHPRMSIETLLHAFLPYPHVDHTHPDSIISLCCTENGMEIAREIYGDRFVWVPYVRPGFRLSKMIAAGVRGNPHTELVLMEKHGMVTWGETSQSCYTNTLRVVQEAEDYILKMTKKHGRMILGGEKYAAFNPPTRRQLAAQVIPAIRSVVSQEQRILLHLDDSEDILRFVNSRDALHLSQVGAACPDHLVHTKRVPLFIEWDVSEDNASELENILVLAIERYKSDYRHYFENNRSHHDAMAHPAPRVILIPGLGMITTGRSKAEAQMSSALYHRAIAVMTGSSILGKFVSLDERESFAVEYWPLELYKLSLAPAEAEFSRQIVFISGGAGGIGSVTAQHFARLGAHVAVADLNDEKAQQVAHEIEESCGVGKAYAVHLDVTNENLVMEAFRQTILEFGGIDIVVNNAGLATSSPIEDTTFDEWNLNLNVLSTGYFLLAREAYRLLKRQGIGGNMVFVASKNAIVAGKNSSAYSSAKALEVHLARCIAAEGGQYGIRVNTVLPDAVLQGSTIWNSSWRNERAQAYGISPDQLENYYKMRTTLRLNVFPEDIAEAIVFLTSSRASKTTGCMITVDAGVPAAFTR